MTNPTPNNQSVITCLSNVLDWFKVKREAEGFKFDESLLKEVQSDLNFLAEAYEVSPLQAFLFALIVEKSSDYRTPSCSGQCATHELRTKLKIRKET